MRSAQMCLIMLAVSLTFTLFQPLRAAAQGSPPPTYTLPPKDYKVTAGCVFSSAGSCILSYDEKRKGPYACTDKGPLENYKKARQDSIGTLQGELLSLAQDQGVQRTKIKEAKQIIEDLAKQKGDANLPALRAAQAAIIDAEQQIKNDELFKEPRLNEINALKDEVKATETSYNQTVTSHKVQCTKCEEGFYLDPTGKCQCTTERQNRAIEENLRGGPAWQTVCGGGQSR